MRSAFIRSAQLGFGALALAIVAASSISAPASAASVPGLYGTTDPTYDGVTRQSLVIVAFANAGIAVPNSAKAWLLKQQCSDGSFQSFRADTSKPCQKPDLKTGLGKDTNSTGFAAVALNALGYRSRANAALTWLSSAQNADGGIPWFKGAHSDSNSTGVAAWAFNSAGINPAAVKKNQKSLLTFIRSTMLDCSYGQSSRGAISYQPSTTLVASDMAVTQVLAMLNMTAAIRKGGSSSSAPLMSCTGKLPTTLNGVSNALAGYLSQRLAANKHRLPDAYSAGQADWSATAWAVLGLSVSGRGSKEAGLAINAIESRTIKAITDGNGQLSVGNQRSSSLPRN